MFCTNCGEEMRAIDKFCASCGAPAAPRPAKTRAAATSSSEPSAPPRPLQSTVESSRAPLPVPTIQTARVNPPPPPPRAAAAPPLSNQQEQQVLLEGEEIASVRGMVPVEALPPEFPPAAVPAPRVACAFCGESNPAGNAYCERCGQRLKAEGSVPTAPAAAATNAWLDVPEPARKPAAAPAAARTPVPAKTASASAAPAAAPGKDSDFFYFYDDSTTQRGSRKVLIVLMVVLALGVLGVIYLMSRPSTKHIAAGNVTITISPTEAEVAAGAAQDFSASVTGSGDTDVVWSVTEGNSGGTIVSHGAQAQGGSVASLGAYTAPTTPGTYHIVATSKADPTKSATAEALVSGK